MTASTLPGRFKPPQDTPPQDWAALRVHLAGAGFALDLGESPRQFAGGMGNLNYLIRLDGREWVLRRPPPGDIPPGANDMAREYLILSKLYRAYPPAPQAIHFCGAGG